MIERKNFRFANTARGAFATAAVYSHAETAKEKGLFSYAYLVWLFKTAPELLLGEHPEAAEQLLRDVVRTV